MVVLSMIYNVSKISNLMLMVDNYCKINVKARWIYFDTRGAMLGHRRTEGCCLQRLFG